MAFGAKQPKLGQKTGALPAIKQPRFVHGSIPQSMSAPKPKSLNTRDYGKKITQVPGGGFGTTGLEREP